MDLEALVDLDSKHNKQLQHLANLNNKMRLEVRKFWNKAFHKTKMTMFESKGLDLLLMLLEAPQQVHSVNLLNNQPLDLQLVNRPIN